VDLIINVGTIKVKDSSSIGMRDLNKDLMEAMEDCNFNGRD